MFAPLRSSFTYCATTSRIESRSLICCTVSLMTALSSIPTPNYGLRKSVYTYEMELYHLLNRGVDKRKIFMDDSDRLRFIHDMWEFNDSQFVDNVRHRVGNTNFVSPYLAKEKIVDIHGWCLMGNHYHLLVSKNVENG